MPSRAGPALSLETERQPGLSARSLPGRAVPLGVSAKIPRDGPAAGPGRPSAHAWAAGGGGVAREGGPGGGGEAASGGGGGAEGGGGRMVLRAHGQRDFERPRAIFQRFFSDF
jgi:hypothetical protein